MALAYVFLANAVGPLGKNRFEVFPFFNWSLFTHATAAVKHDYAIFIETIDGRPLPRPTLIYSLKSKFKAVRDGISLRKATLTLAFAILEKNNKKTQRVRATIERSYLRGPKRFSYSVRHVTYRPLERYRTGKVTPLEILANFEKR